MRCIRFLSPLCLALGLSACSEAPPAPPTEFDPLLAVIGQRLDLAISVALHKREHNLPVRVPERERQVLAQVREAAAEHGLDPSRAEAFFSDQIEANKLVQYALLDRWAIPGQQPQAVTRDLAEELRPRLDRLQATLLDELGQLDAHRPADCKARLAEALAARSRDPLRHLALVRATGQVCRQP